MGFCLEYFAFILFFPTILDMKIFKDFHLQEKCADGAGIFLQKKKPKQKIAQLQTQTKQKRKWALK